MRTQAYYRTRSIVRFLFWSTAMVALWAGVTFLHNHTKITNCYNGDEGYTCNTAWK